MAQIEKTVFISYRRRDISWALAVYQYLKNQNYDVFFDFTSIPSGDFEQIIVSNIRARAHFVLILTPTALDRCSNPGDWLRREIETAIDEKRNIIPLFFDGFNFGNLAIAGKLTGKMSTINRYNGLDIPSGYFMEAMERLRNRYLNAPLDAIIHPVSTEVRKIVKEEQVAANKALRQREDIRELVKPADEKKISSLSEKQIVQPEKGPEGSRLLTIGKSKINGILNRAGKLNPRSYGIGAGILLLVILAIWNISSLDLNALGADTPSPTKTNLTLILASVTSTSTQTIPTNTATLPAVTSTPTQVPPTNTSTIRPSPIPTLGVSSAMTSSRDGMILLFVPAGDFQMGSSSGQSDEKPVNTVNLDAYWIDKTEVTNAMFAKFLNSEGNQTEGGITWLGTGPSNYPRIKLVDGMWEVESGYEDFPVMEVSWYGAMSYCSWVGRRLPTEAEWEKAAGWDVDTRQKRIYPWGNSIDCSFANFSGCTGSIAAVGSYPKGASPYGVLDMAGNVSEWVSSLIRSYPYSAFDGRENLSISSELRVLRGGAYNLSDYVARTTARNSINPITTQPRIGFRCAMDASE